MVANNKSVEKLTTPPHSIEAEQSVLGGVLIDADAWDIVAEQLQPKHFYRKDHQAIFDAMMSLAQEGKPIDTLTVSERLAQKYQQHHIDMGYLATLVTNTPTAANIAAYAEIVYERALLRSLIQVGGKIAEEARDPGQKSAAEILDQAEQYVFDIAEQKGSNNGPEKIASVVARMIDKLHDRAKSGTQITGLSTGFDDFDHKTTGLQPGDLVIVAGRPSMGKTTFAMNIAERVSVWDVPNKKHTLIFSMEMPADALLLRMMSALTRIGQQSLRVGKLDDKDWDRVNSCVSYLTKAELTIDESPGLTPAELRSRARRVAKEQDLGLIIIDYLQLMQGNSKTDNRTNEISEISRSLKALAKELNVPVIALSQLNRSLEQRPNKRPVMSDLRESGAIEQDADLIVCIYRDEVYHEDSEDKGQAEIIIVKQRNGPIGTCRLSFFGEYNRFDNFTAEQAIPVNTL